MPLPPGPQLDAEIAKKLFRYVVMIDTTGGQYSINAQTGEKRPIEPFSSNSEQAYRILDLFKANSIHATIQPQMDETGRSHWVVGFHDGTQPTVRIHTGVSLPHAICLAAIDYLSRERS